MPFYKRGIPYEWENYNAEYNLWSSTDLEDQSRLGTWSWGCTQRRFVWQSSSTMVNIVRFQATQVRTTFQFHLQRLHGKTPVSSRPHFLYYILEVWLQPRELSRILVLISNTSHVSATFQLIQSANGADHSVMFQRNRTDLIVIT